MFGVQVTWKCTEKFDRGCAGRWHRLQAGRRGVLQPRAPGFLPPQPAVLPALAAPGPSPEPSRASTPGPGGRTEGAPCTLPGFIERSVTFVWGM